MFWATLSSKWNEQAPKRNRKFPCCFRNNLVSNKYLQPLNAHFCPINLSKRGTTPDISVTVFPEGPSVIPHLQHDDQRGLLHTFTLLLFHFSKEIFLEIWRFFVEARILHYKKKSIYREVLQEIEVSLSVNGSMERFQDHHNLILFNIQIPEIHHYQIIIIIG